MGSIIPYTKQPTRGPTDHCWGSTSGIIGIFSCGGEPICQGFPEGFLAVSGKVWRNHGFRFYHNILSMVQKSGQPPRMSKTLKIMRNNYHINRWSPDVFFPINSSKSAPRFRKIPWKFLSREAYLRGELVPKDQKTQIRFATHLCSFPPEKKKLDPQILSLDQKSTNG